MPELPEVEIVRRGLQDLIVGKQFKYVKVIDSPKSFPNDNNVVDEFLLGARINSVERRAKVILVDLSSNYTLMIHLRMTGQLVFVGTSNGSMYKKERWGAGHPNDSFVGKLPDRSTRVIMKFTDGSTLYFNDQRKFGWVKLLPSELVQNDPFMKKVGPEPLLPEFTNKIFTQRIRRRNGTTVKAAILDQTVLAGVGNIYADESLWAAQIHPGTRVRDITDKKLSKLKKEIVDVLALSISKGGSTDKNYVNAEGKKGSYLEFANVFRLEGTPCPRCGAIIEKIRVAGRGTHICSSCQPQALNKKALSTHTTKPST